MKKKLITLSSSFLIIIFTLFSLTLFINVEKVSATDNKTSNLTEKVSKDFTKKFCNAIAFGLSKESAMRFSLEENKKVFEKRKGIEDVNNQLTAEKIAYSVIDICGNNIGLVGDSGIREFKNYYLEKTKQDT